MPTDESKHLAGNLAYRPAIGLDQVIFQPRLIQVPRPPARAVEFALEKQARADGSASPGPTGVRAAAPR
jgi:hypothetical protein